MPREWPRVPTDVKGKKWPGEGGIRLRYHRKWLGKHIVSGVESFNPRPLFREIICHSDFKSTEEILWCYHSNETSVILYKI